MDYAQLGWYLLPAVLAGLGFGYFLLPKDGWPLIGKRPPFWTLPFVIIFLALFFGVLVRLIANVFFEGSVDSINKLLLGLAGLLSAPFLVWRTWIADRQRHIGQEELYTGLLVRAVEQLGATREEKKSREISDGEGKTKVETITETVPNTEVRLGAIYALEKLARDYEPLHWPIMEILCAYVRKNAGPPTPCSDEVREAYAKQHKDYEIFDLESMNNYLEIVRRREAEIRPPLPDVQAALTAMGRRSKQQRDFEKRKSIEDDVAGEHSFRLDLSACNLGFVDLRGLHFEDANFERSCFECASLQGAHLN
ncbi:MAG: pentapeptide repeat-containing protein, partial [Methylocystis sp.]